MCQSHHHNPHQSQAVDIFKYSPGLYLWYYVSTSIILLRSLFSNVLQITSDPNCCSSARPIVHRKENQLKLPTQGTRSKYPCTSAPILLWSIQTQSMEIDMGRVG